MATIINFKNLFCVYSSITMEWLFDTDFSSVVLLCVVTTQANGNDDVDLTKHFDGIFTIETSLIGSNINNSCGFVRNYIWQALEMRWIRVRRSKFNQMETKNFLYLWLWLYSTLFIRFGSSSSCFFFFFFSFFLLLLYSILLIEWTVI